MQYEHTALGKRLSLLTWGEFLIAGSALLLIVAQQIALAPADDPNWKSIQTAHSIRVAMDPSYRPFEFWEDGYIRGFDVDLAKLIGHAMGFEVEIVPTGMDSYFDALRLRRVDLVLSSLVPVPEYRKEIAYSVPYLEAGTVLLAPLSAKVGSVQDLNGKRVAVELGSDAHRVARKLQRQGIGLHILTFDTYQKAAQGTISGQAEAVLLDGPSASWYALHNQLSRVAVVESVPYVIATRADSHQLLARVNSAIRMAQRDGSIRELELKWFQP
jgi:polar amino acid transport system substrate-binding protein